jgi:hypothetical protein
MSSRSGTLHHHVLHHPWELIGFAFAVGALIVLGRSRNAFLRSFADLVGEVAAAALVARTNRWIDLRERQPC